MGVMHRLRETVVDVTRFILINKINVNFTIKNNTYISSIQCMIMILIHINVP